MRYSLILAFLLAIVVAPPADAVQRLQITCTAPASGDAPTQYKVERESGGVAGAWDATKSSLVQTVLVGGPLVFVDRGVVSGTQYRYRCTAGNAAGDSPMPSAPSAFFTIVGPPGQAGVTVIVISE